MSANVSPLSNEPLPLASLKDSSPIAVARIVERPARRSPVVDAAGRGFELVQLTLQLPVGEPSVFEPVEHCDWMLPPSVVKVTAVPEGTGLLKRSDRRAVTSTTSPSRFQASTF